MNNILRLIGASALLLSATFAHAQYVWVDAKGVRHFSDRPPPPNTPADKILKAPQRQQAQLVEAMPPQAAPAAQPPAKASGQPTLAEREADFRKRQQERAKQENEALAEAERNRVKMANCKAARQDKAALESGIRIGTFDDKGERHFLTDEERATRLANANRALEGC